MWTELLKFNVDLLALRPSTTSAVEHTLSIAKAAAAWVAIITITAIGFALLRIHPSYFESAVMQRRPKWLRV
jgi:hypothetical protein